MHIASKQVGIYTAHCVCVCSTLLGIQIYHLFGLLWIGNYILALGECTLAGAFASWYWAYKKPKVLYIHQGTLHYHHTLL